MKKTLISLSLLAAFAVNAQTTVDSTSGSASQAGANSGSASAVNASNSGNVSAIGNENASRSTSGSQSGATSGSTSGAAGNIINLDQSVPSTQTINQTGTSTSHTTVDGKTTENVNYTGGVTNRNINEGTSTTRVEYSGTQTVKNVPGIAMSGPASGPCTGVSGGIGLAGPGWGVGLNGSSVMDDCRMRENTRVLGMGMQSLDGAANPQEKGEATVMFMDAMRGLAAYNNQIIGKVTKEGAK